MRVCALGLRSLGCSLYRLESGLSYSALVALACLGMSMGSMA